MDRDEQEEFENLIDVDETILDRQSRAQPRLVWQYGRLLAKAFKSLDEAEANVKVVLADITKAIREKPKKHGLTSVTEAGLKVAIPGTKEYKDAVKKVIAAQYQVNLLSAAKNALEHRRTSLSNFVRLNEQNYFSKPHQSQTDKDKSPNRKPLKKK